PAPPPAAPAPVFLPALEPLEALLASRGYRIVRRDPGEARLDLDLESERGTMTLRLFSAASPERAYGAAGDLKVSHRGELVDVELMDEVLRHLKPPGTPRPGTRPSGGAGTRTRRPRETP
ncbi:MAG: hypothetical protein FJ098_10500, partial [Deltaproteobacteria bacterium]|nr:hypothetical protein [Deltaproteobacteria bacterium]